MLGIAQGVLGIGPHKKDVGVEGRQSINDHCCGIGQCQSCHRLTSNEVHSLQTQGSEDGPGGGEAVVVKTRHPDDESVENEVREEPQENGPPLCERRLSSFVVPAGKRIETKRLLLSRLRADPLALDFDTPTATLRQAQDSAQSALAA